MEVSYHETIEDNPEDAELRCWFDNPESPSQQDEIRQAIDTMPTFSFSFAGRHAKKLATSTRRAREAADYYYSQFQWRDNELELAYYKMKAAASDEEKALADGLRKMMFLVEEGGNYAYGVAAYCLVQTEMSGHAYFDPSSDPDSDDDLGWCLQILASRIFEPELWDQLSISLD